MSELYIVIDENRDINVPEELRGRIVQFDHNVETFTFQCPRYWDGRDLSTMEIFVNYVIDPKKGTCSAYLVKELNVNEADDNMTFDWVVTQDATTKDGELIIFVCAQLTDELGNLQHHWSSNFNKDFKLAKSYKCLQGIVDNYPNIIGQMLADIDKLKENGGSVTFTYNEATGDVTFGNETVIAAPEGIEAHTEIVSINGRGLQDTVTRKRVSELSEAVANKESGTPTAVSLVSEMSDTTKVYLYTGTEEGYTSGYWYYYDGSAWKSGGRYGGEATGITTAVQTALLNCFAHVAWTDENGQSYYDTLATALASSGSDSEESGDDSGETTVVTLTSISATYGGGEVASGTALSDLTDIVVTGNYSDGTTKTITNYELIGEIASGTNIITVSYGGLTTTFEVTGTKFTRIYLEIDAYTYNGHLNSTAAGTIHTIYSDDGETAVESNSGNGHAYVISQTFDEDVNVHFKYTHGGTTKYSYTYISSYTTDGSASTYYRYTNMNDYYVEGQGTAYTNAGNVYEGTYTLKAGCMLAINSGYNLSSPAYDTDNTYFYVEV